MKKSLVQIVGKLGPVVPYAALRIQQLYNNVWLM